MAVLEIVASAFLAVSWTALGFALGAFAALWILKELKTPWELAEAHELAAELCGDDVAHGHHVDRIADKALFHHCTIS